MEVWKFKDCYHTIGMLRNNTQEAPERRYSKPLQSTSMLFLKRGSWNELSSQPFIDSLPKTPNWGEGQIIRISCGHHNNQHRGQKPYITSSGKQNEKKNIHGWKTTLFIETGSDGITICTSFTVANSTLLSSGKTLKLCLRWKAYYQPGINTTSRNQGFSKTLGDCRALFQLCLLSKAYSDCHSPNCNGVTKWQEGQLFSGTGITVLDTNVFQALSQLQVGKLTF